MSAGVVTTNRSKLEAHLDQWFSTRFSDVTPLDTNHSAQPVLLLCEDKLPESMYWETVRTHINLEERVKQLEEYQHRLWSTASGQSGLIGASAAIAWRGDHDYTWECTAWRATSGPRNVPAHLVSDMTIRFPSTILNRDPVSYTHLTLPTNREV